MVDEGKGAHQRTGLKNIFVRLRRPFKADPCDIFYQMYYNMIKTYEEEGNSMNILRKAKVWRNCVVLFALCVAVCCSLRARAAGNGEEVTIYGLDSTYLEKVSIPDAFPQSHQLTPEGGEGVTYRISGGNSAKVSAEGLITPKYTYWKSNGWFSQSVPEGEEYDFYTLSAGDTEITATTAEHSYTITVHVKDYAVVYGDEVMDTYLSENVKEGMTDREIMEAVARFPAGYDYSASYSDVYSMILCGGGDCWASTDAIISLCEKLGIKAWSRNGNKDPGAGGGHVNAMAEFHGVYYELEAGYGSQKGEDGYRPYDVTVRESLFSYYSYASSDGLTIYQYDGYDTAGVLEIPETIHGRPVTGIEESAFAKSDFSEIRLPDTLTTIGDFAFSSCGNLTRIEIPASVTSLGSSVFVSCDKLKDISVAGDSTSYQVIDQVIYTKDGGTLVTCPTASRVTIPDTVTRIADYAFYYNKNLRQITIPESVTEMGEGAFGNCSNLSGLKIEGSGLTAIGRHCFQENSALSVVRIPDSVKTLGAYAFAYCGQLKYIYFRGDAPAFGETIDGKFYDNVFAGCRANAYYPEGNATWTEDKLAAHDGTVTWSPWAGGEAVSLEDAEIFMEQDSLTFTGKEITPEIVVTAGGRTLTLNEDYLVNYTDNINAGAATVTVVGIGLYEGEISGNFTIAKAKREVKAYVRKTSIMEGETTEIFYISLQGDAAYTSDRPSVAAVSADGVISGISAGTAVITVQVAESENYLAASTEITITVTHDKEHLIYGSEVADGKITAVCPSCGEEFIATVPTSFLVYWGLNDGSGYSTHCDSHYEVGDILDCIFYDTSDADLYAMEILSHNSAVATITENRYVNFIADGTVNVEVRPKYHPSIGRMYTFQVGKETPGPGDGEKDEPSKEGTDGEKKEENPENSGNGTQETCYDPETGLTLLVTGGDRKNAAVLSLDEKHAKGKLVIPAACKVGEVTYTITSIAEEAFKDNGKITSVVLGAKIKTIGKEAFSGCKKLKKVTLGKNVTSIDSRAFYNCGRLTAITVPSKVKKIGKEAFARCGKLKKIVLGTTKLTAKNVGKNAFKGISARASVKVPKSKRKAYRTLLRKKGVGKKVSVS